MFALQIKTRARILLAAALAMVIETSCSHAPAPMSHASIREYEGKGVVVRIHTVSHVTYVTSRYAVTDSSMIVREVLRGDKYYNSFDPHLHNDQDLNPPPPEMPLPLELKFDQIKFVEKWEERSLKKDMGVGGGVILGIVALSVAAVIYMFGKAMSGLDGD